MIEKLLGAKLAIVGGGRFCKTLLQFLEDAEFLNPKPTVMGVADVNPEAVGLLYAQKTGLPTTDDYREFFKLDGLELILEITSDASMGYILGQSKPPGVRLVDHIGARSLWSALQIGKQKTEILKALTEQTYTPGDIRGVLDTFADRLLEVYLQRNQRYEEVERYLVESERTQTQIIQGSTIPTFVIDQDHRVTHWNRAMERLTGASAAEIVGTRKQAVPFYGKERPTMADVIMDQIDRAEIRKLYGTQWRQSNLIEGACEAEGFFPGLGENGKWCWFTASPIKDPGGKIVGAIETVWDKTEDKRAEEERERHTRLLTNSARALADSERTLAQIIQGSTIPTFVLNKQHIVTHWNRALENLTGMTASKMLNTNHQWRAFYQKKRATMADVILDQADEDEIRRLYGTHWRRSALIDGAYEAEGFFAGLGENGKWFWFTAAPIKDPDGNIIGAIETLWDKTEDKKAEEDRERHMRELAMLCSIYGTLSTPVALDQRIAVAINELKQFLSADNICIFLLAEDERLYLEYNQGASETLCQGNRRAHKNSIIEQVAKTGVFTTFEDLPQTDETEIGLLAREGMISLAYVPISAKEKKTIGVIRIGSAQPKHFTSEDKHVLELIGNRLGVAIENALLQEQYLKSERKYRSLFNNDPNPIFIIDCETRTILDINRRAQDSYGYDRQELIGRSFLSLGDADDHKIEQGLAALSPDESILFSKKRHHKKDGASFFVNINVSRARYAEREVLIATTTDISESVEKETQLIQAGKMATLGVMAAGMAHEINQPLNVIQISADLVLKMLRKGQAISDTDLTAMATDIVDNVARATGVIKHVREFARQSEVTRTRININDPIMDVFKVMGNQLKVHQIEVELDLAPDLPGIMAEHNRLEQVFINLVTNAIDAMDEKSEQPEHRDADKRLTIRSFAENGAVVVQVADTGVGMSAAVKSKIFEPFFTTKETGKGTGLGTSISYGIIKDYDGQIDIESEPGQGTHFRLTFPAMD